MWFDSLFFIKKIDINYYMHLVIVNGPLGNSNELNFANGINFS